MGFQHTLSRSVSLSGIGLHSGQPCTLKLHPAPVNTGIIFLRKMNGAAQTCEASIHNLLQMELCTAVGVNGFKIQTTEHVLSALWGMEIDNVYIELNGDEVPAMDGSAYPFIQAIQTAGIIQQKSPRAYLKILQPIEVKDGARNVRVLPSPTPKISYSIDYNHMLIQQQSYEHEWSVSAYMKNIADARTFAFSNEVEDLWARGLARGGSLENTVVFSDTEILNEHGLRFPDECVRHKILDLVGDLALIGIHIIGHIVADRSGHNLHTELLTTILDHPAAWTLLCANGNEEPASTRLNPVKASHHESPVFSSVLS